MEEESVADPVNINKDTQLIKDAQKEIGTLDILICGTCHEVFHFVEPFQEHKQPGNCSQTSTIRENYRHETKPQVWAFMLWKNARIRSRKDGTEAPTSWEIYQEWCKLESKEKDAWIAAGKNVQNCSRLSDAQLLEVKVKPQVYSGGNRKGTGQQKVMMTVPSLASGKGTGEEDPLEEGEIRLSQLPEVQRVALKAQAEANKVSDDADPLGGADDSDSKRGKENEEVRKTNDLIKKGIIKPVQLNSDVTILPGKKQSKEAASDAKSDEYAVDKIISKRYNPRKKTFEYLVKWENFDKNEYTWEPTANLEHCKALVEEYEANLKKQRMQKAEATMLQRKFQKKNQKMLATNVELTEGRPQRSSKQKALNQVKAWCGDISDADDESSKRKYSDDDSDSDSFEKKMKMEEEDSESDDDEMPTVTVKKTAKSSVNGVGKSSPSIGKILIPDSKGIVRINQKQASELSSGVYIMSKTAGIIKLDSNTSKLATSGGQAIVKVEPRIGQTQIKVVRRDALGNTVKLTPKLVQKPKVTLKSLPKTKVLERKQIPPPVSMEKKDTFFDEGEESDDGVPDLEFPTDLPLPEPDSPPGEFVLDPETGKIAGQEYPEEPEQPPVVEDIKQEKVAADDAGEKSDGGLENLVKLAAADILDDEMTGVEEVKNEEPPKQEAPVKKEEQPKPQIVRATIHYKEQPSNSSILQRKLLSTPRQTPPPPTIRRVAPKKPQTTIISPVRSRQITQKPKQYVPTITRVRTPSYPQTNRNVHKKIGQTTIYRTVQKKPEPQPPIILNTEAPRPTETVINMPLLSVDETSQESTSVPETLTDLATLSEIADTETPLLITGEDGTVYQVAGQNEQGQTILISQSADGQSQCLVVATESLQMEEAAQAVGPEEGEVLHEVAPVAVVGAEEMDEQAGGVEADDSMVAQLVSADPPSPGGRRNVTVMLPDSTYMTMLVTQEQYESLELDK